MLDAYVPSNKETKVKGKQMEVLKRLGHEELVLDEYERTWRDCCSTFGFTHVGTYRNFGQ